MDWEREQLGSQPSAQHLLDESCCTSHFTLLKTRFSHQSNGRNHAALPGASESALQTEGLSIFFG